MLTVCIRFVSTLAVGTHITLLGKIPSPKILLKALEEVKPNLIICVPLILEKIYRKQILPMLNKRPLKWALNDSVARLPYLWAGTKKTGGCFRWTF